MRSFEVEQKYRLKNPAVVRNILRGMGAKKIRSGPESNELFDLEGMLKSRASVLRLRRYGKEAQGLLTFKGPCLKSRYKKRVEIETPVPWAKARALLRSVGFKIVRNYCKNREEFVLGKVHVTVDRLSEKGWFLEIEGAPARITGLQKKLGLSAKDREERTYLEILGL